VAGPGGINRISSGTETGTTLPLAVEPNSRVSLSSSGQMVYSGQQRDGRDVFVAGPDGQPTNLTNTPTDDIQPAWSPDGGQVAFSSGRTGSFKIFAMGADGSAPTQLTDGRGFDEWPAWSPDGQQVAFVSDRDGNAEIYLMAADGSNLRRLTNNPAQDWPVSWSPEGRWLVFGSNRDGNWNLYLVPAAGGAPVQLTSHPADERDPVWLSNGDIAFAHNGPGNWDIFTLSVPTDQLGPVAPDTWTQVTNTPQDERFPALVN
jgi:Tol biopolymer transport system component